MCRENGLTMEPLGFFPGLERVRGSLLKSLVSPKTSQGPVREKAATSLKESVEIGP